jgi:DNA-directed RNA polymerase subunit RPC12/RpoP
MECPKCRSTTLMIRRKTGLERLRCFFTGLRSYRCRDCDQKFRALDRRHMPRDDSDYEPSEARTRAMV